MKVYFVVGEASGDALAGPLLKALRALAADTEAVGLAGDRLMALGVHSPFDIEDISVMGVGPVVKRLPTIVRRVHQTVADVLRERPDVLVIVDSPDFTHAVAKRVRRRLPDVPVVDYVCPSVWAWRSGRARAMRSYVDHVLTLLPFEPDALRRLGGPPGTYVGHPLAGIADTPLLRPLEPARLLVLPGSRRSEHERLMPVFERTVDLLTRRGSVFEPLMPVPERFVASLQERTARWSVPVQVVAGEPEGASFGGATAALAASGTVSLELALRGVPMVLAYRTDAAVRAMARWIDTWSTALPNLIADRVVVPENIDAFASPERLARQVEELLVDTPVRRAQMDGLRTVRRAVATDEPASEKAARIVIDVARQRLPTST